MVLKLFLSVRPKGFLNVAIHATLNLPFCYYLNHILYLEEDFDYSTGISGVCIYINIYRFMVNYKNQHIHFERRNEGTLRA
jgi:hypothetical protein